MGRHRLERQLSTGKISDQNLRRLRRGFPGQPLLLVDDRQRRIDYKAQRSAVSQQHPRSRQPIQTVIGRRLDWIEAADDKVRIHVGRVVHDHRATMAQLEERLPAPAFIRIHRSTIVNVARIREFVPWFQGDWILVLADGTRLQSGKSYRSRIRELIGGW